MEAPDYKSGDYHFRALTHGWMRKFPAMRVNFLIRYGYYIILIEVE